MAYAEEKEQACEDEPSDVVKNCEEEQERNEGPRDEFAFLAKYPIDDVAPVELTDRQEVEGGDKKPYPSRVSYGMYQDVISRRQVAHDQAFGKFEQERLSEDTSHGGVLRDLYG